MQYETVKRLLLTLGAARAHRLVMKNLDWFTIFNFHTTWRGELAECPVSAMGLRFPNPVGLAAGFTVNGERINSLGALGFGFIEAGPFTAARLEGAFNVREEKGCPTLTFSSDGQMPNAGIDEGLINLKSDDGFHVCGGILGISLVKDFREKLSNFEDLRTSLRKSYKRADFFSFDTAGLGDTEIQNGLCALVEERKKVSEALSLPSKPIVVKLYSGRKSEALFSLLDNLIAAGVDGLHVTGVVKDPLTGRTLTGAVLRDTTMQFLATTKDHIKDSVPVITSGGICSAKDAADCIEAGAKLVELLTGFVDRGPALVTEAVRAIAREGKNSSQAVALDRKTPLR